LNHCGAHRSIAVREGIIAALLVSVPAPSWCGKCSNWLIPTTRGFVFRELIIGTVFALWEPLNFVFSGEEVVI